MATWEYRVDEWQMEVNEDEVLSMDYEIPFTMEGFEDEKKAIKAAFEPEEKRVHIDTEGRMWSAASKLEVDKEAGVIKCRRMYHRAGQILAESIEKAGEFLKLRIPLAGEYKVGKSWADTH